MSRASLFELLAHDFGVERLVAVRPEHFGKEFGDEPAGHQIGVGDGERAAAPISCGAGIGAGGIGADAKPRAVEMQDRAAAGRDGMDLHHRRAHPDARDFRLESALEFAVVVRDVGRSAAHVEADDALEPGARAGPRHRDHAARRPREDRVLAGEEPGRRESSRRHHEHHPRAGTLDVERLRHPPDIAGEDRREIGVDDRRVAAADELDQGGRGMALGDLPKSERARDPADNALMRRIAIRVHEDDRDGAVSLRSRPAQRGAHGFRVRRRLYGSVGEHALVDLDHARVKQFGLLDRAGEDLRPRLIADLERIAEAARCDQERPLALPLQQRVGRDRRAHLDDPDRARRDRLARGQSDQAPDRLDCGVFVSRAFGEEFSRMQAPARIAPDHVGEGAAAIDPEVPAAFGFHNRLFRCPALWRSLRKVL